MKATNFEFRFRLWIGLLIYLLGFLAPWERALPGANHHLWSWLALQLFMTNHLKGEQAFVLVAVVACAVAVLGAWLRVWGTAYLGHEVVRDGAMHASTVVAAGPYRWMRNPLYLGSWLTCAAVSILMPPTGALFALIALALFQWRLAAAERAFLEQKLGEAYRGYVRRVPALIPYKKALKADGAVKPRWGQALLNEIYPLGMAASFAALSWRYDVWLLVQCMLILFGTSLVVRAILPRRHAGLASKS
jgi:protein-S-isoprenylcysteine O-methyltransferase Ste14